MVLDLLGHGKWELLEKEEYSLLGYKSIKLGEIWVGKWETRKKNAKYFSILVDKMKSAPRKIACLSAQPLSHIRLCNPMDHSPPGSSIYGIFQAKTLEWVAISFSRGSSPPRDQIHFSCIPGEFFFTTEPQGKPQKNSIYKAKEKKKGESTLTRSFPTEMSGLQFIFPAQPRKWGKATS